MSETCQHKWRHLLLGNPELKTPKMISELEPGDLVVDMDRRRCSLCDRHEMFENNCWVEVTGVTFV